MSTKVLDDFRSYYLMQKATLRGRRNAVGEDSLKQVIVIRKHIVAQLMSRLSHLGCFQTSPARRDSWSDEEMRQIIRAQWPAVYKRCSATEHVLDEFRS